MRLYFSSTILCLSFAGSLAHADGHAYSPYVGQEYPQQVFFGDTHLHTTLSFDAYGDGNTTMGSDEAYRFAKGEELGGHDGVPVRISRPLDFLVVADHAEYMGVVQGVAAGDSSLKASEAGARWAKMATDGKLLEVFGEMVADGMANTPRELDDRFVGSVWNAVIDAAEQHNDPGKFTALIGYEWSSVPQGDNLHRVVIFRDGPEKTKQVLPFSLFDSEAPEDLWAYMANYESETDGRVLAIPHNGNLSAGRMFELQNFTGAPLTEEYAQMRMRFEPLIETTQIKGDSETHPLISPEDEFADFERWDLGNLLVTKRTSAEQMQFEYTRAGLKQGLVQAEILGENPFKYGMIGATDSHTSFASTEEDNYLGKYGVATPNSERWLKKFPPLTVPGVLEQFSEWQSSQSGLAAVWATDNTREALWDAMYRKEVYATTGPRMTLRFFGGWEYRAEDAYRNNLPEIGYSGGVPMGGDLAASTTGEAPTFLVAALRDPDGANLDRIQIVKGWQDIDGTTQEHVYNVAWSGDRAMDGQGKLAAVGNTVDLKTANYSNSIGTAELTTMWTDPDFDPSERAFYYARVIEIPTPRWTAFDELRYGIQMSPEVTRILQERAYSSPIWFTPKG